MKEGIKVGLKIQTFLLGKKGLNFPQCNGHFCGNFRASLTYLHGIEKSMKYEEKCLGLGPIFSDED